MSLLIGTWVVYVQMCKFKDIHITLKVAPHADNFKTLLDIYFGISKTCPNEWIRALCMWSKRGS